jgi:hypothetical protein
MTVGTKSVLYGAHCFFLHPWFVAYGWWKLYGFPFDPRLWFAFFLHDIGYLGKPNMDGPEGEQHPVVGAKIMHKLFGEEWGRFTMYHSRYIAKKHMTNPSKLCFADKLAIVYTPSWLYLPMVTASGEIEEYLQNAKKRESQHWTYSGDDKKRWHKQLKEYMVKWVAEHKDGAVDTWTNANRNDYV